MDRVDHKHRRFARAPYAADRLGPRVPSVGGIEQAIAVGIEPQAQRRRRRDDRHLSASVEHEVARHRLSAMVNLDGEEGDVGPDGRMIPFDHLPLGREGDAVVDRDRVARAGRRGELGRELGGHQEVAVAEGEPGGEIEGRDPPGHRRHADDPKRPEHADIAGGVGDDPGVDERLPHATGAGEVELVGN